MCPKIRYDEKSEKFCKFFWELKRPKHGLNVPTAVHRGDPAGPAAAPPDILNSRCESAHVVMSSTLRRAGFYGVAAVWD
jgi:hypothetical protein